ncbi:aminophospholipid-transporting P-type ATPase [Fomitiporia mediterranea MF3/22]|uniref:aminophospholipid-transporting P-type ATPase n=1 Tax=Fomitiporia mediterranea (strain MF3/22) TaxID=694068 RepID=UPI000440903B|nr:aminophospholipid-transporting P-type ATPase [Fomitiporia mediterranea MF3/22]EJD00189.1 aminophospholipid-transporting P-type ATPase [Fomitiporia mediterranea MF3/22]
MAGGDIEKQSGSVDDSGTQIPAPEVEEPTNLRSVAFPDAQGDAIADGQEHGHRTRGVDLRRELTIEEKQLAQAGYDEYDTKSKTKGPTKKSKAKGADVERVDIHEHKLTVSALAAELQTSLDAREPGKSAGLTEAEARARLERDGKNELSPPKKKSALRMYIDCLLTMFNILLIVAGILEYALLGINFKANFQNTYLGGILIAVAFLNAFIEFYQLQKSAAILASFLKMIPPSCRVLRGGGLITIPASDLVKGDIVLIRMGDKTPADLVLFSATEVKVDNSSLTGESEPQERRALPEGSQARPVEAENLVFNSTLTLSGEGWGVVVRTGDNTMIGQIAALTGGESGNKSPLAVEIGRFVVMVSSIALVFAIVFFAVGITTVYNGQAAATVTFAVSVLVAFVPEGLPSTVTLLLSIAAKRMAKQNVLVKDLQGVETLGSLTLLATDKTGTLTRNQMTVTNVWSEGKMYTAFQSNNDDPDTSPFDIGVSSLRELVDAAALNSRIKFDRTDVPFSQRAILGDATETGLARFVGKYISDYDAHQEKHRKVFEVPFNSANKWALVIVDKEHADGRLTLLIKGAPERVLKKCSTYMKDGELVSVTDEFQESYERAYDYMASRGHRVIACAQLLLPETQYPSDYAFSKTDYPTDGYCFLGLISLEDPPKHGVREAIGTLRLAGIKVMMVTGDHPKTAEAIARKINLILGDTKETLSAKTGRNVDDIYDDEVQAVVVHGDDIDKLQGWQWDNIFSKQEIVFARTSPQHKLEIVKRAQALGHIVGVTGDGVNDSPALKKADLGIAMNMSGSDVSKEAANMVLLDDNFASTVKGVQEGRQIFVNLKRSIQYTISHSTPEVIPQLLYVVVPIPLPLSAILILVIDLGFELFVALSFAWDPPETKDGVMRMPPRKPVNESSINRIKRRALRRAQSVRRDIETQEVIQPGRLTSLVWTLRKPFTVKFWEDKLEQTDDETLVDAKLLSYSYLEAGMIEMLGSMVAYFVVFFKSGFSPSDLRKAQQAAGSDNPFFTKSSPDFTNHVGRAISAQEQVDALAKAQSIVYLSIFIMQCFNLFAVKAKFTFPFGRQVVSNYYNFLGILGGACLGMFIIYTPPLHVVFGGTFRLSPLYWLIPVAFGVLLLGWASIRVLLMRKGIEQARVKDIKGLMMFPTMRTMSMRSGGRTK